MKVKRPSYLFFLLEDSDFFDIPSFLRGELKIERRSELCALSILSEARVPVSPEDLTLLAQVPTEGWISVAELGVPEQDLQRLVDHGVLLSNADESKAVGFRESHERLVAMQWHPQAALYHFMSREGPLETVKPTIRTIAQSLEKNVQKHIERHGKSLPAFHHRPDAVEEYELPLVEKEGELFEALLQRKTLRGLDSSRPLELEDFSVLLRYTFGCHGLLELSDDFELLHKTSPSGGSLHPIEAYPLVLNVESLVPGIYHYDLESHFLRLIHSFELSEARNIATAFCREQDFASSANVLFVMVARFFRNFWKYRQQSRAYSVIQMDCGHLSQSFYLLATTLGLGAFYTGAIDSHKIGELLSLVPQEEAAVGICGCGHKGEEELGLAFEPFVPRSPQA